MKKHVTIEGLDAARNALNDAIEQTLLLMSQKNVMEGSVSLTLNFDMAQMDDQSYRPHIGYKTAINVPLKISGGESMNAERLYWDPLMNRFVMEVAGEQVRMDEIG